ncbi:TIR domain-containing protein [Solidesulfovibrio sp. C21]|uniref:TIR domain-containing protein n=1 Tax=Solidesulfovibrio sp. C21 TaxID=3398613 RepID=UPI0039FD34B6
MAEEILKTSPYANFAFISYSREDTRNARFLQQKLEGYRFPADLVAPDHRPPDKKYLRPVIRDKSDLEVNSESFWEDIKSKLDRSRYLVVLCSPSAALSEFVAKEICHFLDNPERREPILQVVPVIIAGNPGAGDETECLPPPLFECKEQILSRNLPSMLRDGDEKESQAWERGLIQTIAFLLHMDLPKLTNRYQQQKRQQFQRIIGAAAVLLLVFAGIAILAVSAEHKATQTLAQADFQEASRLLDDDQREASMALAYLGSSLSVFSNAPARERLYGLLLNRSWLLHRETSSLRAADGKSIGQVSPRLDLVASELGNAKANESALQLCTISSNNCTVLQQSETPKIKSRMFTASGDAYAVISDTPPQRCTVWSASDGRRIGGFDLPEGSRLLKLSKMGTTAAVMLPDALLRIVAVSDGRTLLELRPGAGNTWLQSLDILKEPQLDFDALGTLFVVAEFSQEHEDESQPDEDLHSRSSARKSTYRIRAFRLHDGKELFATEAAGKLDEITCSPAGGHVAYAASTNTANGWELTVEPLQDGLTGWRQHLDHGLSRLEFSPDGMRVVAEVHGQDIGAGHTLQVHDAFFGGPAQTTMPLQSRLMGWAFSHDARRLAILTMEPELRILNIEDGREVVERLRPQRSAKRLAFTRDDGSLLVSSADEVNTYLLQISPVAPRRIETNDWLAFVDAAAINDTHLALLESDAKAESVIYTIPFYFSSGQAARPAAVDSQASIESEDPAKPLRLDGVANCLSISPDGRLAVVGTGNPLAPEESGRAYLYQLDAASAATPGKWKLLQAIDTATAVMEAQFSEDGSLLALMGSSLSKKASTLWLYDTANQTFLPEFIRHDGPINAMRMSRDGTRIVTGGSDYRMHLWNVKRRSLIGSAKCNSPPRVVDMAGNGWVAAGARWPGAQGELVVLKADGSEAWDQPRRFNAGITHVAFDPTGELIAVSMDRDIEILDAKTGRPHANTMTYPHPVVAIGFAPSASRSALCVAYTNQGPNNVTSIDFLDPRTGRKMGESLENGGAFRAMKFLPHGYALSLTTHAAVLSPPPPAAVAGENVDFLGLTAQLGGWKLNEWRAPEPYRATASPRPDRGTSWGRVWVWLNTPAQERTIEPESTVKLLDRLDALSKGSRNDVRSALDIKPDFAPALAEYWLQAALEAAQQDFMRPVNNRSEEEQYQRGMEWKIFMAEARGSILGTNPRALRLADFLTQDACEKQPNSAAVWRSRATFLRLADRMEEAGTTLDRALTLAPDDIEILKQAAFWHFDRKEFVEALALMHRACDSVHNTKASSLESICSLGMLRVEMAAKYRGFNGLEENIQWILSELDRRIGLHPDVDIDDEGAKQLSQVSGEITQLLCRFYDGPSIALAVNLHLANSLSKDKLTSRQQLYLGYIFANAACSALLSIEINTAITLGKKALQLASGEPPIRAALAHALLAAGNVADAMEIYNAMLKLDDEYAGSISWSLYQDLLLLQKRGLPVAGTESLRRQLEKKLAAKLNKGVTVVSVQDDSQAARLGIKVGDRIILYDNEPILDINEFAWARGIEQLEAVDAPRTITVVQDGKERKIQVHAGLLGVGLAR